MKKLKKEIMLTIEIEVCQMKIEKEKKYMRNHLKIIIKVKESVK